MYETMRLGTRGFWRLLMGLGSTVLWIVGTALVMISCAVLVYLGAALAARLAAWAFFP